MVPLGSSVSTSISTGRLLAFALAVALLALGLAEGCTDYQYLLKGRCTECVSSKPTASTTELRGTKCWNPEGNGTSCAPGQLYNAVAKSPFKNSAADCISATPTTYKGATNSIGGGNVNATILMPYDVYDLYTSLNAPPNTFNISTMSLEGIPADSSSKPIIYKRMEYFPITFKDTRGVLKTRKGKTVQFTGAVKLGNQRLPLCFTHEFKVCKT